LADYGTAAVEREAGGVAEASQSENLHLGVSLEFPQTSS
jgi:hypothetical protein